MARPRAKAPTGSSYIPYWHHRRRRAPWSPGSPAARRTSSTRPATAQRCARGGSQTGTQRQQINKYSVGTKPPRPLLPHCRPQAHPHGQGLLPRRPWNQASGTGCTRCLRRPSVAFMFFCCVNHYVSDSPELVFWMRVKRTQKVERHHESSRFTVNSCFPITGRNRRHVETSISVTFQPAQESNRRPFPWGDEHQQALY